MTHMLVHHRVKDYQAWKKEFDTEDHARTFAESDDLREVMERAGVVGQPEISYLDHVEHFAS